MNINKLNRFLDAKIKACRDRCEELSEKPGTSVYSDILAEKIAAWQHVKDYLDHGDELWTD